MPCAGHPRSARAADAVEPRLHEPRYRVEANSAIADTSRVVEVSVGRPGSCARVWTAAGEALATVTPALGAQTYPSSCRRVPPVPAN